MKGLQVPDHKDAALGWVCRCAVQKVRTCSQVFRTKGADRKFTEFHAEKSACTWEILWLVHGISPIVFDPIVLVCGIASKRVEPKYWILGIISQWFWSIV